MPLLHPQSLRHPSFEIQTQRRSNSTTRLLLSHKFLHSQASIISISRTRILKRVSQNLSVAKAASAQASSSVGESVAQTSEKDVLKALSQIIDPDFGTDIVSCGFVKDLGINEALGEVSFRLELTTPACPVKDMFENKANEVVAALPWVKKVNVTMSAQPAKPIFAGQLPFGLSRISNIIAVSSCKVHISSNEFLFTQLLMFLFELKFLLKFKLIIWDVLCCVNTNATYSSAKVVLVM
jgi:metal-sulfur cluster biosynthetic enzyme